MGRSAALTLAVMMAPALAAGPVAAQEPPAPPPEEGPEAKPEAGPDADPAEDAEALRVCLSSFTNAQRLRRGGKLLKARDALVRCAAPACPGVVQNRCVPWLEEVRREIPSVVVEVRGYTGEPVLGAEVRIDERLQLLDGRGIELDPGPHLLQVRLPDGAEREQVFEALQGQRNQALSVTFGSTEPREVVVAERPPGPLAITGYVGFAVGGVGLLVGAITGGLALSNGSELQDQCDTEGCTQNEIDRGLALAHTSTATLLIGGLGVTVGIIGVVLDADARNKERNRERSQDRVTVDAHLGPTAAALRVCF